MSATWRDIHSVKGLLWRGTRWRVVKGEDTLFWQDRWLRAVPLLEAVVTQPPDNVKELSVRAFWMDHGGWDMQRLQYWLSCDILQDLQRIHLSSADSLDQDVLTWEHGANGRFSTAVVKSFIRGPRRTEQMGFWRQLWAFKGPQRASDALAGSDRSRAIVLLVLSPNPG